MTVEFKTTITKSKSGHYTAILRVKKVNDIGQEYYHQVYKDVKIGSLSTARVRIEDAKKNYK